MRPRGLEAVFEPHRIALVGASDQPGRIGETLWHNLSSFSGEVVPVTPDAVRVDGRRAYASLRDVDGEIDLAVIVVPATQVPGVIRDAAAHGVGACVVISGGFAETGPRGAALQAEVLAAARAGSVRIVGPNSFGVQNCDLGLNASLARGSAEGGGGISLATQSGAYGMAIQALAEDEKTRFAKVYAAGNKADFSDAEVLRFLRDDEHTRVLCFYAESLAGGRDFIAEARLTTPVKPVIVAKTGKSRAGARAARFHTAALAGSHAVAAGAFAQAGIVEARSGLEMLDAARALAMQPLPRGSRVAIVTNSGGTGVELVDLLDEEGLETPELTEALQADLRAVLPALGSAVNPVDITPVWHRFSELYPLLVDRLARSGEVDVVVPVLLHRSALDEDVAAAVRDVVLGLRTGSVDVPVYVCWVAPRAARSNADLLQAAGVPCFEWPERTARAIGHAVRYARARATVRPPGVLHLTPPRIGSLAAGVLSPMDAAQLLVSGGVHVVETAVCASVDEALAAAEGIGYPVVAKVVHPEVLHKSDAGGVITNVSDAASLARAAAKLLTSRSDALVLLQRQEHGVEVIVGGLRDAELGPAVMVGLGGIFVEALGDVSFGLAPVETEEALELIWRLRGIAVLTGARGTPPVDLEALAVLLCAVGDLMATGPDLAVIDLNPVLAGPLGCVAVDWRVEVEKSVPRGQG
ncbi:MAG: acetate--CoA ligase family protein [Candidatus Dormibacteraeota bacterium]|nr:acetate--CoA ligase family protein [Candidatus Dormibacteraeota bacterium]